MEGGQSEIEQKQQAHIEEIPSSSKQLEMQIFQKHEKNILQPPKTQRQFVMNQDEPDALPHFRCSWYHGQLLGNEFLLVKLF